MDAKKILKAVAKGFVYTFVGYLLSGSSLSWLLGLLIVYLELEFDRGKKR